MTKDDKKPRYIRSVNLTTAEYGELTKLATLAEVSVAQYVEDLIRATLNQNEK